MHLASLFSLIPWPLVRSELVVSNLVLVLIVLGLGWGLYRQRRTNQKLRREQEALQKQQTELAELNKTQTLLFSALAHDVRSPLSSLHSLLTLLDLGSLPTERLATHKERLTRTLDTTLQLLDSLLSWSVVQPQQGQVQAEYLLLNELLTETLTLVNVEAERKHITLYNKLQQPCPALADPNMTRMVLRNLLSNAIKFTPESGTVTIAASRQGDFWEVAIADSGVGITAAGCTRIFGESGLYSTNGTADERGAGLGLRLCKEFIERNGGQLRFDTAPEQGTTFRFTIPATLSFNN
jgi:two-component system sensor histidine kinase/response regulator